MLGNTIFLWKNIILASKLQYLWQHGLNERWSVSSSESKNRNVWGIITQISLTYTSKCFKNYLNLKTANGFHKDTDTIRCPTVSIEVLTSKGTFVVLCTYIVHFRWNFSISHFSQLFFLNFFSPPPVIFPKFSDGSPRNLFWAP